MCTPVFLYSSRILSKVPVPSELACTLVVADNYIFWPKMPLCQKGPEWHCVLISDGGAVQPRVLGFQL